MSSREPDGPYVYQPFGMQDKAHWEANRVWGVSGVGDPFLTKIRGLTKEEATAVCDALKSLARRKGWKLVHDAAVKEAGLSSDTDKWQYSQAKCEEDEVLKLVLENPGETEAT